MGKEAVVVTGIALATALGDRAATWRRLVRGDSGLRRAQPFGELPPLPLGLLGPSGPVELMALARRLGADVLRDGNLAAPLGDRWGVAVGSSRSFQGDLERWRRDEIGKGLDSAKIAWPLIWPGSVAAAIAATCGTLGPAIAPMAACGTGLVAITQGSELVRSGQCRGVIAGAIEAPVTPLTIAGFLKMGALSRSALRPFDRDRDGFALGEGGALLLLESRTSAIARGARIYGTVLGGGHTVDADHSVAPGLDLSAAQRAMDLAIARSTLPPEAIGYVHAHGTGTALNDAREAHLIQTRWPQGIPTSSTKGATGHTLGASGAIGAALALLALDQKILPPCVGLNQSAFPQLDVIKTARPQAIAATLTLAFGFGGVNSALVMAAEPPP
jgi:3-oxoacyl-[acyl-carrier-protein] synthase II